jgi:hypothetical protein
VTYQEAYAEFLRTNKNASDPAIAFVAGWDARLRGPDIAKPVSTYRRNDEHDPRLWED